MRIVQSYWSLPAKENDIETIENRNSGGFCHPKYNAISWMLSSLKLKSFYKEVILYTDKEGEDWLINKLKLPYSDVVCNLDSLDKYNSMLWALPKVFVYGLQDRPFLHVDGDVFIWKRFSSKILNRPLIAQSYERSSEYVRNVLNQMKASFPYIPDYIKSSIKRINNIPIGNPNNINLYINAGVLGGTNIEFIQNYSKEALRLVDKNTHALPQIDVGKFNVIFEQFMFKILAEGSDIEIALLFEDGKNMSEDFLSPRHFFEITKNDGYMHLLGLHKKNMNQLFQMEARLAFESPKRYKQICDLYKNSKIYYPNSITTTTTSENDSSVLPSTKAVMNRMGLTYDNSLSYELFCNSLVSILEESKQPGMSLLKDIFEVERGLSETIPVNSYINYEDIYKIVANTYSNNRPWYENLRFSLNITSNRIIFLSHSFNTPITQDYLYKVAVGEINLRENTTRTPLLISKMERNGLKEVLFKYIKGWNIILIALQNNSLSISGIKNMFFEKKIPYSGNCLEKDIASYVIDACFRCNYLNVEF